MPRLTGADLDEFLDQPHVGVLATLRGDGLPYTVPVWWLWHENAFWLTGTSTRVWCRQLMADPRASLCIEAMAPVAAHVGCDGPVTFIDPDTADIWPISAMLVDKYVRRAQGDAAAEAFLANMRTEPRVLFRLEPRSARNAVRAIDMRVYEGKRADREYQAARRTEQGTGEGSA